MHPLMHGTPKPTLDDIVAGFSKVSGHRAVLIRLNQVLSDENAGTQDLTDVLNADAGLAARVISAANTVLFRGGLPVSSVDEAVVRVGMEEIRRLLLGSIAYELTAGPLAGYGFGSGELWNRSLGCAVAMDWMGRATSRSVDVCHTIGLMHPLGMVVIDRWLISRKQVLGSIGRGTTPADLAALERDAIGFSNAEVCARLLRMWKFPESIIVPVSLQDDPLNAGRFKKVACLLAIARWQATAVMAGLDVGRVPPFPAVDVVTETGLTEDAIRGMIPGIDAEFAARKAAFGLL